MLIAWMIYAVAITAIVAGCALALDRVAEIWGASRRVIWLAALMIAVLVPLGLAVRPVQVAPVAATSLDGSQDTVRVTVHALPTTGRVSETEITRELLLTRFARPRLFPAFWNRFTGLAWLVTSIVLSGLLFRGAIWLWRGQTRWHRSIVDGHSVLLTNDVGPAVVGVVRPRILLPAWALALNAHERGLMLEHEAQHVRARDPMLSAIGAWAIALFPWNPAVWFIVKRLRLSIEIDCDRRVLARRRANARDYGILLLTVGTRTGNDLRFAVSLAEPRRFLEQRILAMTSARPSRPLIASAPFVGIALLAAVAMAQTPRPESTLVVRRPPTPPAATPKRNSVKIAAPQRVVPPVLERVEDQPSRQPPRVVAPTPPRSSEGLIPIAPAPRTTQPIPIDVVRAWIQARHPNVIAGDPHVNAVTIVVDENNSLLASVTDSLETEERRKGPSIVVDGRLIGTYEEAIHTPTPRPVIVVDGVRIDSTTQLDTIPIESIDVLKGKSAAAEYGPDAQNGIVIIRSMRPNDAQLRRLGVSPNNIAQMTELRLRPGVIGPNRLYVAVLQLKKY